MKQAFFILLSLVFFATAEAKVYKVKNLTEYNAANKAALPGDEIILLNGDWHNVTLVADATGTAQNPITIKAETAGKVNITGVSKLLIGGSYLVIDGLYFNHGYSDDNSVIKFRSSSKKLANYCRVTNSVIDDFNPKRMDESYWLALYGRHNRIDHCSFKDKKNMGVLIAIMLDTDESRENFHSIDHNYFGRRPPLASNTGEIIRVGVSTYCEYNSNTQITDNYFYHCDGETEVVSLKSGGNLVKNNLLYECQGSVVLRHGNYNTVANNVFIGNNKPGTGGVRIINKGQWVVNNFFYKCRGIDFRSPLSIMNGVPNSPAFRYVAVTDALVANNSFVDCTPISFAEGSDTERSVAPKDVTFVNNLFYNNSDSLIYNAFDDISGISFANNAVSNSYRQQPAKGFSKTTFNIIKTENIIIPSLKKGSYQYPDCIKNAMKSHGNVVLSTSPGFTDKTALLSTINNAKKTTGAKWLYEQKDIQLLMPSFSCANAAEVQQLLSTQNGPLLINLTGSSYQFNKPLLIHTDVTFTAPRKEMLTISNLQKEDFLFLVQGNGALTLSGLNLDLGGVNSKTIISGDTSGSSNHTNIIIRDCSFTNSNATLIIAPKSNVSDSIVIAYSKFTNFSQGLFNFMQEDGKKGYYNVEHLTIKNCQMTNIKGQVLGMLRSGNDESTMGPNLQFHQNVLTNCNSNDTPLIYLFGTQVSNFSGNTFVNSNPKGVIIKLEDNVRAHHRLYDNTLINSGKIEGNKFVE